MSAVSSRHHMMYGVACAAFALVSGGAGLPGATSTTNPIYRVTTFGAKGDGVTDDTAAFEKAIASAQRSGGGEVYVPAGTYAFTSKAPFAYGASVRVFGSVPVTILGADQAKTVLVEHVPGQPLISLHADGSAVENLTLDTQSFDGGAAVGVRANNTLLDHDTVHGGDKQFALYYIGPTGATPTAPLYNVGNRVLDMVITDRISDDGFSFSFQKDATIANITHTGSRLALYVDNHVSVTDYSYAPGTQARAKDGFYLTAPSQAITITNFTTAGSGGIVGGAVNPRVSSDITITNEQFVASSGYRLEIGNVDGLTISQGHFRSSNALYFDPPTTATGVMVVDTVIPAIRFSQTKTARIDATFQHDTFAKLEMRGRPSPTFWNLSQGPTAVHLDGGRFFNESGGIAEGPNLTISGTLDVGRP